MSSHQTHVADGEVADTAHAADGKVANTVGIRLLLKDL